MKIFEVAANLRKSLVELYEDAQIEGYMGDNQPNGGLWELEHGRLKDEMTT